MKLLASLCLSIAALPAATPFRLEQVLGAPFVEQLTAGPGGRVAWIQNARGVRNIWIAEAPDYKGRQLTSYTDDDGLEVGQLAWASTGKTLAFVRGGDAEHPGSAAPMPNSTGAAAEQSVWLISLDDRTPRKIGEGFSPVIIRDRVAYIKGGAVWSAGLGPSDKPAQLLFARGVMSALTPSPDGSTLAMVSSRADHSFVAVYNMASKSLLYLDPALDSDGDPAWSPDSKSVAFIRIPADATRTPGADRRSAKQPWSIRVADAATGKGRQIFVASAGPGSRFAIDSGGTPLLWGDGRIIFPWERDGWLHLYSVSPDGGGPSLLTSGNFEVERMALSPDRKSVIYCSNQEDIDRRHLWRVGVRGEAVPTRVTQGNGIEWAPTPLEGGAIAYAYSGAKHPGRAAILKGTASQDLAPSTVPADFPESALAEPQPVMIAAADGMQIHGQVFLPPPGGAARKPALIFFHGGSRRQMLLGWHYMYYYSNAYAMNQYLASQGYVVLSVNYRSGIGYGLDFREALHYGLGGASEYNDVIGAGLYMRGRPDVDPSRIGLWGGSYGGYLTALGLARGSDMFKAGVDFHGVHDWSRLRRGMDADPEAARLAFQSSPMASVDTWRSPVLLIHGDDDRNVPFNESVRLVEALRDRKVPVEQLVFPDEVHDFLTYAHWHRAYTAMTEFFSRRL